MTVSDSEFILQVTGSDAGPETESARRALRQARTSVSGYIKGNAREGAEIPEDDLDQAIVGVATNNFLRVKSPSGGNGYVDFTQGQPQEYVERDPLGPAKRILRPYMRGGFA